MRHRKAVLFCLIAACVAAVLAYILIGLTPDNWGFNFPRRLKVMAAVILVGAAIGLASTTFQTITANHILTPSIMGLDSLYLFLQTVVVFFFGSGRLVMMSDVPGFFLTLLLMIGSSAALFKAMFRKEGQNIYFLVLIGFVCGTVFSGLANFMQVIIDPSEYSVLEGRMFATFNRININLLGVAALIVAAAFTVSVLDFKYLDVINLGRDHAVNLGVPYQKVVLRALVCIAVLTSAATVLVGPITFLGILAVSLGRALMRTFRHAMLVGGSVLVATTVLVLGMFFTERVLNFTTPLSVIINFIGGLYFLFLLLRAKNP